MVPHCGIERQKSVFSIYCWDPLGLFKSYSVYANVGRFHSKSKHPMSYPVSLKATPVTTLSWFLLMRMPATSAGCWNRSPQLIYCGRNPVPACIVETCWNHLTSWNNGMFTIYQLVQDFPSIHSMLMCLWIAPVGTLQPLSARGGSARPTGLLQRSVG